MCIFHFTGISGPRPRIRARYLRTWVKFCHRPRGFEIKQITLSAYALLLHIFAVVVTSADPKSLETQLILRSESYILQPLHQSKSRPSYCIYESFRLRSSEWFCGLLVALYCFTPLSRNCLFSSNADRRKGLVPRFPPLV